MRLSKKPIWNKKRIPDTKVSGIFDKPSNIFLNLRTQKIWELGIIVLRLPMGKLMCLSNKVSSILPAAITEISGASS